MKNLYFIAAYSHRCNEWARYLISAESEWVARNEVEGDLAAGWRVRHLRLICTTNDVVFTEL